MMKSSFILLFIALSFSNASDFVSLSRPPVMSPSEPPVMSPSVSEPPVMSPSVSKPPVMSPSVSQPPVMSLSVSQPPVMSLSVSQPPVMSLSQPPVVSPTSEPSNSDCSSVIYSMVDCLSFLTVGSTDPSPTKTCCGGIKTVLVYNPQCFCSGLESSREMGFVLDDTKALAMPKICNVPIDPHCDVVTPAALTPISPTSAEPPKTSPSSAKSPPSLPAVTPSLPASTHSSPAVPASSPAATVSSQKATASSPAATSPSLSKSSSGNLSVSKLFLAAVIVSSFVYISA